MPLPAILLGSLRVAAAIGRSAAMTPARAQGLGAFRKLGGLRDIGKVFGQRTSGGSMPDWLAKLMQSSGPTAGRQPLSAGAFPITKEVFSQAAKSLGTANPSATQLRDYTQQQQPQLHTEHNSALRTTIRNLAAFSGAAVLARSALRDHTQGVSEAAENLRPFSSTVSEAMAKFELAGLGRQLREASATGGSTAALLAAKSHRLDAASPITNEIANLRNTIATGWTNLQTSILSILDAWGVDEGLKKVRESVESLLGIEKQKENDRAAFQGDFKDFLRETGRGNFPSSPTPDDMRRQQRRPGEQW